MKTTLLMAAVAAGVTLAASAEARDGHGPRMQMPTFEELDLNGDGGVTAEEVTTAMQARAEARFAEADTNGDGALSAEEMLARAESARQDRLADRITKRIERADANGDGVLQMEELRAARGEGRSPDRLFNRFDADENGSLSAEEFAEAQAMMERRGDRGHRDNH